MRYKIIFSALISIWFISTATSQPKIEFEIITHDFGVIVEGSVAKYDFSFTNTGNQPLVITNVRASCGCTTPSWTTTPVMPGDKGVISAGYNSKGRPGMFNKSISVMSNAEPPNIQIYIKGEVKRSGSTDSPDQSRNQPKISLEQSSITVGKVERGQGIPINIEVNNQGTGDLRIEGVRSSCDCVTWSRNTSPIIKNGNKQILQLVYTPQDVGNQIEEVIIFSNDGGNSQIKFEILAEVVDNIEAPSLLKQNNVLKF